MAERKASISVTSTTEITFTEEDIRRALIDYGRKLRLLLNAPEAVPDSLYQLKAGDEGWDERVPDALRLVWTTTENRDG